MRPQVGLALLAAGVYLFAPVTADACMVILPDQPEVTTGPQCTKSYTDPDSAGVYAYPAERVSEGIIRQSIGTGACGGGERIVVYFDCPSQTGVWLGGALDGQGLPPSPVENGVRTLYVNGYGIDNAFAFYDEQHLKPALTPETVLRRAKQLSWVEQTGELSSARIAVEGKAFDMNCGCKLFYPNGVN